MNELNDGTFYRRIGYAVSSGGASMDSRCKRQWKIHPSLNARTEAKPIIKGEIIGCYDDAVAAVKKAIDNRYMALDG